MIQGADVACTWCLREMTEQERLEYADEYWAVKFLVPNIPKAHATPNNKDGREFMAQVCWSMPDLELTNLPIEVSAKIISHRAFDLLPAGELLVAALKQAGLIMYPDQVRILSIAHENADHVRTEITIRRLHAEEIEG